MVPVVEDLSSGGVGGTVSGDIVAVQSDAHVDNLLGIGTTAGIVDRADIVGRTGHTARIASFPEHAQRVEEGIGRGIMGGERVEYGIGKIVEFQRIVGTRGYCFVGALVVPHVTLPENYHLAHTLDIDIFPCLHPLIILPSHYIIQLSIDSE